MDIKLSPIQTTSGLQVIASVRDVTEQKKAQEVIRKLSEVVYQSPVAVCITDKQANIEYVNPAFTVVTGYSPAGRAGAEPANAQIGGKRPPRYMKTSGPRSSTAVPAGKALSTIEGKTANATGPARPSPPIANVAGEITHFVSVKEDITERIRMEEAVRESEVKYRELVENASSIILKMDCDGIITFFNEYAQEFFGYSEDDLLGKNIVGTIVPQTRNHRSRTWKG